MNDILMLSFTIALSVISIMLGFISILITICYARQVVGAIKTQELQQKLGFELAKQVKELKQIEEKNYELHKDQSIVNKELFNKINKDKLPF